ncbi:MAG: PAS domain S-box protein [Ferruginibacter sp.]
MTKDKKDYSILVIEDNPGDLTLIEDYLEEQIAAPHITQVKSFAAAKLLLEQKEIYDVILLDLSLPDKSGEALITEMNALCPVCPVIVLTGYTDIGFSIKSLSLGIADYLLKEDITATSLYKSIIYNIERKKTNLELAESEKRYSNLFHLSPQPMWVFDQETLKFIQVNDAAMKLYGYSEAEFLNISLADIKLEKDTGFLKKDLEQNIQSNDVFKGQFNHIKKSGEIINVEIYSNLITIDGKKYRSVIAIDITEKLIKEKEYQDQKAVGYKNLTKAVINAQEKERTEIGEELHDNVNQLLAASKIYLNCSLSRVEDKNEFIIKSSEYIGTAMDEIRKLSHALVGVTAEKKITLCDSIEELIRSITAIENIAIDFTCPSYKDNTINEGLKQTIYRIVQEQLSNILKYAEATKVEIEIKPEADDLLFTIIDNGKGFNTLAKSTGIGLRNIRNRAAVYNGEVYILSSVGNGCKMKVIFKGAQIEKILADNETFNIGN